MLSFHSNEHVLEMAEERLVNDIVIFPEFEQYCIDNGEYIRYKKFIINNKFGFSDVLLEYMISNSFFDNLIFDFTHRYHDTYTYNKSFIGNMINTITTTTTTNIDKKMDKHIYLCLHFIFTMKHELVLENMLETHPKLITYIIDNNFTALYHLIYLHIPTTNRIKRTYDNEEKEGNEEKREVIGFDRHMNKKIKM